LISFKKAEDSNVWKVSMTELVYIQKCFASSHTFAIR